MPSLTRPAGIARGGVSVRQSDPCVVIPLAIVLSRSRPAHVVPLAHRGTVADVGTGSGAIAVALALHLSQARIYATDVSPDALEVARINLRSHGLEQRVDLLAGDMLEPLPEAVDIIAANLPYVRDSDWAGLMPEIRDFEPKAALLGGSDGLDKIRLFLPQAVNKLRPQGLLLFEIGQGQGPAVLDLARHHFPSAEVNLVPDLAGIDRVVRVLAP